MMNRKDASTVYTLNGFLRDRRGEYRILVLAEDRIKATEYLGFVPDVYRLTVSRDTRDWTLYDGQTSVGDLFATPLGTYRYFPVDAEDIIP